MAQVVPLLAKTAYVPINPTQTTVTLEKPFCVAAAASVNVFVVRNDAADTTTVLTTNTYASTNIGATAPYLAVNFPNPSCTNPPSLAQLNDLGLVQLTLDQYVIRIGNSTSCFNTPVCNGPLQDGTTYRFLYVFLGATQAVLTQTAWSQPITTPKATPYDNIDLWPGRRSGGMIVITSILSVLTFFVLAGLVAAIITSLMSPSGHIQTTHHEVRSSHTVPQKAQGIEEVASGTAERYAVNPQV
ncbi:uroplakin-3a isoform X2 [Hyperolius riggenbachi]